MRIKNIVIPVAAATMLVFGSYGCGSESEAEQTVEQTDDTESATDTEDTADTDESDTAGDTAEQSAEEDTSADENTTAADDTDIGADESDSTGDTAGTDESAATDAESTTGDESAANENGTDESTADESGVTVNSAHDDVQLGDDEYKGNNELDGAYESLSDEEKAEVDQILEEVKKEHPELFEDNSGNIPYTGPAQGTPDTGELDDPDYQFGQGDYSEGAGAIVY